LIIDGGTAVVIPVNRGSQRHRSIKFALLRAIQRKIRILSAGFWDYDRRRSQIYTNRVNSTYYMCMYRQPAIGASLPAGHALATITFWVASQARYLLCAV
jgi:hypothetical protein